MTYDAERLTRLADAQDELLRPREVAELFGVRTATIAHWARQGRITPLFTPGGHRRYRRAALRGLLDASGDDEAERVGRGCPSASEQ